MLDSEYNTYSAFITSEANYMFYIPRDLADPPRYVMWRFDYSRLQHSRVVFDLGDEGADYHMQKPVVVKECLLTIGWYRSDPQRYPRIKYTWLGLPPLKLLALRALFAGAPVEVCERWAGWARLSNVTAFLRQVCPERVGQFSPPGGGAGEFSV